MDLRSGTDRIQVGPFDEGYAVISPDNSHIAFQRFEDNQARVFVGKLDYLVAAIPVSPPSVMRSDGSGLAYDFSPDGSKVIVTFEWDAKTYLVDVATGERQELASGSENLPGWQRLAP